MREGQANHDMPEVTLSFEIDSSLERVLDSGEPLNEAVRRQISSGLAEILNTFGIPGIPAVQVTVLKDNSTSADQFLHVIVNDQLCRYPDELLQRAHSYVNGAPLNPAAKSDQIATWLHELSGDWAEMADVNRKSLVEFLSMTCLEIVKRQPDVLLGPAPVLAYQASLLASTDDPGSRPETWPPNPTWLLPVLRKVLSLKISIANKQVVAEVLKAELAKRQSQEDVVEGLIVALSPDVVEIQLPQDYLRQITTADSESEHDKFAMMRDGLFYELGLRYPKFRFVPVEGLKPNSFAFKISHLTTLPQIGLQPNECLVNDTPDRLKLLNIQGKVAINPANGNECSIIDVNFQQIAASAGLITWNQIEYLVLCFAANLRENGVCFLHREAVQDQLAQLEQAFPALVKTVQAKVSVEQITRVFRTLLAEEISIRNLRLIFEWIVDYDYVVTDPARYIIFDDRLPTYQEPDEAWLSDPANLTSFVRSGMKRYISHKYTRGQSTLIVYLLSPEIEKLLSEHQAFQRDEKEGTRLDEDERDKILQAVRAEVDALPPSASTPAILTTIDVRPALRDILAPDFPRLPVLAYQELSPDMNIQPIARISLNS